MPFAIAIADHMNIAPAARRSNATNLFRMDVPPRRNAHVHCEVFRVRDARGAGVSISPRGLRCEAASPPSRCSRLWQGAASDRRSEEPCGDPLLDLRRLMIGRCVLETLR